jgi:hypothetical protein
MSKSRRADQLMKVKGLQIMNDHGWTIECLQAQERRMKNTNMGIEMAELLNLYQEMILIYDQKFNRGEVLVL